VAGPGSLRVAAVQVWFAGGAHRDYLILHRRATGGSVRARPARTRVWSFAEAAPGADGLDLRKPRDAARLAQELGRLNLTPRSRPGGPRSPHLPRQLHAFLPRLATPRRPPAPPRARPPRRNLHGRPAGQKFTEQLGRLTVQPAWEQTAPPHRGARSGRGLRRSG